MKLLFENEVGRLQINGGGRQRYGNGIYLQRIHGLGMPEKEYLTASYVNQPGQTLISEKDSVRLITLSVDLCCQQNAPLELRRLLKIIYMPGVMTLWSGAIKRQIVCRCTKVEEPVWHGKQIASFVLQFTCDKPYFTDVVKMQEVLFSRTDLIRGSFTLPCVFTQRIMRRTLVNRGDVLSEPIITFFGVQQSKEAVVEERSGISIVNHTNGKRIELLYEIAEGETVTLDISKRSIRSDRNGNIMFSLGKESYLSDFWLDPGENDVEVIRHSENLNMNVSISCDHRYLEAVI